jgi:hypothetical protein
VRSLIDLRGMSPLGLVDLRGVGIFLRLGDIIGISIWEMIGRDT